MATINESNYFVVQGYMISELGLKGNELIIFAIINGFSQAEDTRFTGSLQYLCDWTGMTKQGVINILKSLVEKSYISKDEWLDHNVKHVAYRSNYLNRVVKKNEQGGQISLTPQSTNLNGGSQITLPNNIYNNKEDNKEDNNISSVGSVSVSKAITETLEYLNKVCHKNFKTTASGPHASHIKARLRDGFTVEDFKKVIDFKYAQWGENPTVFSNGLSSDVYLRPQTLFSTKFDNYLNEANSGKPVVKKVERKVFKNEFTTEERTNELRRRLFGDAD